ncbi:RHS repeat-associated core domain-containing protein [Mitsuaria sp. GD03876]|uniref:RHS repeat domain-containing protein n=1 Tax=Mitsuaria sp. GD03876 TaxID=2975399 RepID=UPI00244786E3|nr:RHS repeat-associated core domain-containing protein [Mitsuaria sp. GD03876]MDH0867076.1 hypothetical protein [Mitsuaria sp. GD03876]
MRALRLAMSGRSEGGRGAWRSAALAAIALAGMTAAQADPYSYIRTSAFTYKANGLLESETVEPDQPNLCATTTYAYSDAFGNRTAKTTSSCAGASTLAQFPARGSTADYGTQTLTVAGVPNVVVPLGAFSTSAANALGHPETRVYDPRFGVATQMTGPNGVATSWTLDELGRKVLETRQDGTATAVYYCWTKVYDPGAGGLVAATTGNAPLNSAGCHNGSSPAIPSPQAGEEPADAVRYEHTVTRVGGTAVSGFGRIYYDRAGRKIRTVAEGFDGGAFAGTSRLVVQDTDYNAFGVAVTSTQPYFLATGASITGGGAYGLTMTEYDALGRAVTVHTAEPATAQQAGGNGGTVGVPGRGSRQMARTSFAFDGNRVTAIDDKGRQRIDEKGLDGQIVRSTDAMGAQVLQQYDAFGNLVVTRDPLNNRIVVEYDTGGRKVSINDPDGGVTVYCYDALGQLKAQQTSAMRGGHAPQGCPAVASAGTAPAVAGWTTFAYDALGRMVSRAEPEYTSAWVYDSCAKGNGKLCQSSTSHGVSRRITYDGVGRVASQRTDVAGELSAATAVSYDAAGRVLTQTYPTGVTLRYEYTARGFLNTVKLDTQAVMNGATLAAGTVLWTANAFNAWGRQEQATYGNGVATRGLFDSQTGRVTGLTAGPGAANSVVNQSYVWDSVGLLTSRLDRIGDTGVVEVSDGFAYDALGRLTAYAVSGGGGGRTVSLQYNALGLLLSKSDVGNYSYGAQGVANGRPHAVLGVQNQGQNFGYDLNGNATSASGGKWRTVSYTSFNMADAISGAGPASSWKYDDGHQRIKETKAGRVTWYLHPDNAGGLSFEREVAADGTPSNRHYLNAGGQVIGVLVTAGALPVLDAAATAPPVAGSVAARKLEYWHKDQLGSLIATTDHAGNVTARYAYDPFGKRRYTDSRYDPYGNLVVDWRTDGGPGTDRGFTGHEHLDDFGIVHMNGRLYDPTLGRMMQVDPFVQDMLNLQNYDRYGYCYNSPLVCTDPSGYSFLSKLWKKIWNNKIIRTVIIVVVAYYTGQWALEQYGANVAATSGYQAATAAAASSSTAQGAFLAFEHAYASAYASAMSSWTAGAVAGAAGGFAGALVATEGNVGKALRAGVAGAVTGGVGAAFGSGYSVSRVAATAVASGVGSAVQGGSFWDGLRSGALTSAMSYINYTLRQEMIEQSRINGNNDGGDTLSRGMFGDKFKLAGGRVYDLASPDEKYGKCSVLGCWQAGPGSVFGIPYSNGSVTDMVLESFAGPHDKANSYWWYVLTPEQVLNGEGMIGNAFKANHYLGWDKWVDFATNYTTSLMLAAPLAAGPIIEQSHTLPIVTKGHKR